MMAEMVSLQKQGQSAALAPYLQSLVLPEPEAWFVSRFGDLHCSEKFAWNECMGPRLAMPYGELAKDISGSFALTLSDLIAEGLTNFEAVNYAEDCPGPMHILTDRKLVGTLTTTVTLPGLAQQHEPVYGLWSYSETKETLLAYFVYSAGGFRYLGILHEASVEDYQKRKGSTQSERAATARYLTEDQVEMSPVVIDPAIVRRTVVLRVSLDRDGRVKEASYVRGNEAFKDNAIKSVRKRKFDPPGFGPNGFHPSQLCTNVVAP